MPLKTRRLILTALTFGSVLCLVSLIKVHAQDTSATPPAEQETRQIKLSDFTKKRPPASGTTSPPNPSPAKGDAASWNAPTYRRVKPTTTVRAKPVKAKASTPPVTASKTATPAKASPPASIEVREVGVTLWRLRPARQTDTGPGFSVLQAGQLVVMTPERIEGTSPVTLGDRVRLSIESPRNGYLYVINREQYADGTTGAPALIFPTLRIRGGDNSVMAGRLVDLPDPGDPQPFFTLTSQQKPGQPHNVGELLTILITPRPLEGLTPGRAPLPLTPARVAQWEADWESEVVELLEMNGGAGKTWTPEEKLASEATRSLTQVDPTPQTIYRLTGQASDPVMLTVQLLYGAPATPKTAVSQP